MPELVAKMRMTASKSRSATNGRSHHFFSRAQNRKNSRNTVHMDDWMIRRASISVEFFPVVFKKCSVTLFWRL